MSGLWYGILVGPVFDSFEQDGVSFGARVVVGACQVAMKALRALWRERERER